jgi:hypothetical protein
MRRAFAIVTVVTLGACSSSPKPSTTRYEDPDSLHGAWALLSLVPSGAERVIEVDFARLRGNASVGPMLEAWGQRADARALGDLGFNPVLEADLIVMATYPAVGGDVNVVLARGARMKAETIAAARQDASAIDPTTVVFGPGPWREKILALDKGDGASVLGEESFVRLRNEAIPKGAPGASLRATARFAFGRRVQLAGELGIDEMPGTASVWGDVADDVAVLGLFTSSSDASARRLAEALDRLYRRELSSFIAGAAFEAKASGSIARVLYHVGPNALARLREKVGPPP